MAFQFKQFIVEDGNSTLRVGTDSMLLGSWANPVNAHKILDIGTGCGVLALMMAQKSGSTVEAIEIDRPSVKEARLNFSSSPWKERISVFHTSLQEFSGASGGAFDFIITNPPFFSGSLKSPSARKNITRHNESLTHIELVRHAGALLTPEGTFALILPALYAAGFQKICKGSGLFMVRRMVVHPRPLAPPGRILMEFSGHEVSRVEDSYLDILDSTGYFSDQYLALTDCFHHF